MEPSTAANDEAPAPERSRVSTDTLLLIAIGLGVALSFAALVLGWLAFERSTRSEAASQRLPALAAAAVANAPADPPAAGLAFAAVESSIVIVRVERAATETRVDNGLGTGIVVSTAGGSGQIITANHVVTGADRIMIVFNDGSESAATVSMSEPARDLAVLGVARMPASVIAAPVGASATLEVGDDVFVVGHALGLTSSITGGIVSGLDRSVPVGDVTVDGLIQFDAAANPGNSGGPLVDSSGRIVGVVTALANPTNGPPGEGIGFAVPVGPALDMAGAPDQ